MMMRSALYSTILLKQALLWVKLPLNTNNTKIMMLVFKALDWNRYTNLTELNRLIGFQLSPRS